MKIKISLGLLKFTSGSSQFAEAHFCVPVICRYMSFCVLLWSNYSISKTCYHIQGLFTYLSLSVLPKGAIRLPEELCLIVFLLLFESFPTQ